MRIRLVSSVLLGLCAVMLVSGCVVRGRPGLGLPLITIAPPVPRVEVIPRAPYQGLFWVDGHWVYERNGYVWRPGYWERQRPGYRWTPNTWRHERGGWRLYGGNWQRY